MFLELRKDWKEVTDKVFDEGGTDVEAFVLLGLSRTDHKSLLSIEEYADHFDNGMTRSEAWWSR